MNKKLLAAVISGSAVLVAAVIVVLSLTGTLKFNLNKGSAKKNETSSVSSDASSTQSTKDSQGSGGSKSTSEIAQEYETKSTGKEEVAIEDAEYQDGSYIVPIYATKNDGICAARIFVSFDTTKFEYADVKAGDMFDDCTGNFDNGKAIIIATSSEGVANIAGAGVIANLVLVPKSGVPAGEYSVTIDSDSEYANNSDQLVSPTVSAGKIVIK